MIIECDTVNQNELLKQGDVFEFITKTSLWKKYGVVITADCDIVHGKNSDVFSYCPIISINDYLSSVFIRKQIRLEEILIRTKKLVDKSNKNRSKKGVDINVIYSWIIDRGIENALADIDVNSNEIKELISFIYNYRKECDSFSLYLKYKSIIDGNFKKDEELKKIKSKFKSFISSLPGDLFYINYIHSLKDFGYIVNLRIIGNFAEEDINVGNNNNNKIILKRIARMIPPFNYRLTQKLAQMFSDIGLPKEYEEDRNNTIEMLFSNLGGIDE
jgi:hypothetical protein